MKGCITMVRASRRRALASLRWLRKPGSAAPPQHEEHLGLQATVLLILRSRLLRRLEGRTMSVQRTP
jgi:hypothetical protein